MSSFRDVSTFPIVSFRTKVTEEVCDARRAQEEQKDRCRTLEARLHVHERRLAAEIGRWKEEADRADEMAGKIGAAESKRDDAVTRYVSDTTEGIIGSVARMAVVHSEKMPSAAASNRRDMRG